MTNSLTWARRALPLALLVLVAELAPVLAVSVSLVPPYVEKTVPPGRRVTDTIAYTNESDGPVQVSITVSDFEVSDTNEVIERAPGTQPETLAPHIRVTPTSLRVGPGERVYFRYSVEAPEQFTHLHAMVFFVTRPELPEDQPRQVVFVARMGIPVYVESPQAPETRLQIEDLHWERSDDGRLELRFDAANEGGRIFRPRGEVEVRSTDGRFREIYPLNAGSEPVLPHHVRRWARSFGPVPEGELSVRMHIETSPRKRYRSSVLIPAAVGGS